MNDTPLYDIYVASRGSAALVVGVKLGVFAHLADGPSTPEKVAAALEISERGARALLRALLGLCVLRREGDAVGLTPMARSYLVPGRSAYMGGLIALEMDHYITPAKLLEAVKTGRQQVYPEREVWSEHGDEPAEAARFAEAMQSISHRPARALARQHDFAAYQRLLDVGGGSGVYVARVLKEHEGLRATLLDIEPVCALAGAMLERHKVRDRVDVVAADMFVDPWPGAPDIILFAQILHDWPPDKCLDLLRKAFETLPPGGRVLIHEKLIEADGGPTANALVDLDMLFWTEGQQLTQREATTWLTDVGFEGVVCTPTVGYWSLVRADKPE